MRLLSWNLFGLSDVHLDLRSEAAMFVALLGGPPEVALSARSLAPPPEVLMFQEVVERSHVAHLRPHLGAAGYTLFPAEPHPNREYYELIAVRAPLRVLETRCERLESQQGRELLSVVAEREGVRWWLGTGHLESMDEGARLRRVQGRRVRDRLAAWDGPAVFAGDTNLRDDETAALAEADELLDAWEACGAPAKERWTYHSQRRGRGARYDQVWGRGVRFSGFACVGREPVAPDGQTPSDHLGVRVEVEVEQS